MKRHRDNTCPIKSELEVWIDWQEKKYGVVYTPDSLADFVAELLNKIIGRTD